MRYAFACGVVMGLALSVAPAFAENRPSETPMFQLLNGEVRREVQADGGGLSMWTADAGVGCASVLTGAVYEMHCNAAAHFCAWGDGGCNSTPSSPNYGRPVAASSSGAPAPYYVIMEPGATGERKDICAAPASGASLTCALFRMK